MDEELERRKRLRAARKRRFRYATEACEAFNWKYQTYKKHETLSTKKKDFRKIKPEDAKKYAPRLGVKPEWILYNQNPPSWAGGESEDDAVEHFRRVPIVLWEDVVRLPEQYEEVTKGRGQTPIDDWPEIGPKAFALEIEDDSMVANPPGPHSFPPGNMAVFDPETPRFAGCFVCAHIEGVERAVFRKFRPRTTVGNDLVYDLTPLNSDHASETVGPGHKNGRIIGVLVRYIERHPPRSF